MKTQDIKILATIVTQKGSIKKSEFMRLKKLMSSQELKLLMKYLQEGVAKNTVYVTIADELSKKNKDELTKIFEGKKIISRVDKSIGAGVKVQHYDMIYDLSITSNMKRLVKATQEII